jgi:hypothetical protein
MCMWHSSGDWLGVRGCRCVARLTGPGAWDDGEGEGGGKIDVVWKETCIAD